MWPEPTLPVQKLNWSIQSRLNFYELIDVSETVYAKNLNYSKSIFTFYIDFFQAMFKMHGIQNITVLMTA